MSEKGVLHCRYGDHLSSFTFCYHPQVAKSKNEPKDVKNSTCYRCPLYSHGDSSPQDVSTFAPAALTSPEAVELPQVACIHRGEEQESHECRVCTLTKKILPVFSCPHYEEGCSPNQREWELLRENRIKVKSCLSCTKREIE